jgi:hypothetical protein
LFACEGKQNSGDAQPAIHGDRGQITDMPQPRYGQQVMDVLLPF